MKRVFYTGGFIYNPRNQKVLLRKTEGKQASAAFSWESIGGVSKRGENQEKAIQRIFQEVIAQRLPMDSFHYLYDYPLDEVDMQKVAFVVFAADLKKEVKPKKGVEVGWHKLEEALKLDHLSPRTRQDLTFFSREIDAKKHRLPHLASL